MVPKKGSWEPLKRSNMTHIVVAYSYLTTKKIIMWRINASCSPEQREENNNKDSFRRICLRQLGSMRLLFNSGNNDRSACNNSSLIPNQHYSPRRPEFPFTHLTGLNHFKVPISCKCQWISSEVSISGQRATDWRTLKPLECNDRKIKK